MKVTKIGRSNNNERKKKSQHNQSDDNINMTKSLISKLSLFVFEVNFANIIDNNNDSEFLIKEKEKDIKPHTELILQVHQTWGQAI